MNMINMRIIRPQNPIIDNLPAIGRSGGLQADLIKFGLITPLKQPFTIKATIYARLTVLSDRLARDSEPG